MKCDACARLRHQVKRAGVKPKPTRSEAERSFGSIQTAKSEHKTGVLRRADAWGLCGSAFGVGLYCSKKSLHHSQIFPDMSSTPNGLAPRGNDPTGALSA